MEDKEFLEAVKVYIEGMEDRVEGEWGDGRSVETLIHEKDMPAIYWEVIRRIG